MLSDEAIDLVTERLVRRINNANTYLLKEIGKSIKKIGTLTPSQARKLVQVFKYGGDIERITKKLAKITEMNVYDIYKIFDEIAKNDYQFAEQFYKYRNVKYIPYKNHERLKSQVRTLASMTANEYLNITKTTALGFGVVNEKTGEITFKGLKKLYYDLIDEAVLSISQGKEAFDEAMYRQLKQIGESGLKVVYPTTYIDKKGIERHYTRRLDSAVRMNIKSGLTNMHIEMQKQLGKEFDSDGVEISVHNNPAPDHEDAQGRQFSNEEFENLQETGKARSYDGKDIDMVTYHTHRPIGTMNCYHYTFAIILGVNKPQYTDKQLEKIKEDNNKGFEFDGKHYTNYEGTQLQRKIETAIRDQQDELELAKASGNEKLIEKSTTKLTQLRNKYTKLNNISGLPAKLNRLRSGI